MLEFTAEYTEKAQSNAEEDLLPLRALRAQSFLLSFLCFQCFGGLPMYIADTNFRMLSAAKSRQMREGPREVVLRNTWTGGVRIMQVL